MKFLARAGKVESDGAGEVVCVDGNLDEDIKRFDCCRVDRYCNTVRSVRFREIRGGLPRQLCP